MTVENIIISVFGTEDYSQYEQTVYEKHQQMAEAEIITQLNTLLSSACFLILLKQWSAGCACRFIEYRDITVRMKSGRSWKVSSPVFLRAKPKNKRGRTMKRQQGALRHLGLEVLGIIKMTSPALIEVCISMVVLCPSFEVASQALRGFGITMNEHLLQNITHRFASLAKSVRVECHAHDDWQKKGLRVLICVDGGRIRVKKTISDALKLSEKETKKLSTQIRELLWNGNISGICDLVKDKLAGKRKAPKAALKKLHEYFGNHDRFQYKTFRDNGLPTGSGTVESAIRRVINLRIKGAGLFWGREHAEHMILLRSLVLTGKLKNACRKGLGIVRNMFDNNTLENLPLAT